MREDRDAVKVAVLIEPHHVEAEFAVALAAGFFGFDVPFHIDARWG